MSFYKEFTWIMKNYSSKTSFGRRKRTLWIFHWLHPCNLGARETLQTSFHRTWPGKSIKRKYTFFFFFCYTVCSLEKRTAENSWQMKLSNISALWGEVVEGASIMHTMHCTMVGLHHVERTKTGKESPKNF